MCEALEFLSQVGNAWSRIWNTFNGLISCATSPCTILSAVVIVLFAVMMIALVRKSWVKNDMKVKQAEMEGKAKLEALRQTQKAEADREASERTKMHLFDENEK